MGDSIFLADGDAFVPTEHARGPWDPKALHGGAPAALIASAFERMRPGEELPFARLEFEFLRPVPVAPLRLHTEITRPGRRVQALEARLSVVGDGTTVCRARALRIAAAPSDLPEQAVAGLDGRYGAPLAPPQAGEDVHFALDGVEHKSFAGSAMEMRFLHGHSLRGEPSGQATVWMRLRHPLLPGQPLTALARLVAASDFGNGVAFALPFQEYLFINADLTISLDRRPEGDWIALDAKTLLHPGGIGWAESVLHDERGPLGRATQALVVQRR
jgi:acyl-coenzyme A thioesterase PaaI-like protein